MKLGWISFGGPTGQIAIMHHELVDEKQWISESRFLHALNYCMLLPGPEAQQLAIYVGWLLHRTIGGIIAGAFFVLPSIFLLWTLSFIYVTYGNVPWIASLFYGLKAAVIAIVASAVLRIGKKALKSEALWLLAAASFVAIFFFKIPFPLIILGAGVIGFIGGKFLPSKFIVTKAEKNRESGESVINDKQPDTFSRKTVLDQSSSRHSGLWCIVVVSRSSWQVPIWVGSMRLFRKECSLAKQR
jgi:chromate transporter